MDKIYECAAKFVALQNCKYKKDKITYGGNKLYWLLKEKITMNEHITLYKHKDYVQS